MMNAAAPRDGRHARSLETRERILLAAEKLFAEFGIDNVSLRDVSIAAGQKNNGAVQYHFGDRDSLVRELAAYRARATEQVRAELLGKLVSGEKPPQVRDYVNAFVLSLASALDEDNYFLRFLSRLIIERGGLFTQSVPESTLVFMRNVMRRLLPHLSDALIEERWKILMTSTVHVLSTYQVGRRLGTLHAPLDQLLDDLVNVLSAGLEAPASALTLKAGAAKPGSRRNLKEAGC
jgi:AcrR family transcriptional regulator